MSLQGGLQNSWYCFYGNCQGSAAGSKDSCCHGKDARMGYLGDCSEQMVDVERQMCIHSYRWFLGKTNERSTTTL